MAEENVLVVGATGRQGYEVCRFLKDAHHFQVFGTSRQANNPKLTSIGVVSIPFKFGDRKSIDEAMQQSQASLVFFLTDFIDIAKSNARTEILHGTTIIDACKSAKLKFIVFSSIDSAENAPKEARHFATKIPIEAY